MARNIRTILCPIDFEDNSLCGLETAADLARIAGATVSVLHVLVPVSSPATSAQVDACVAVERAVVERMEEACSPLLNDLDYRLLTRTGDPAVCIVRTAEEQI